MVWYDYENTRHWYLYVDSFLGDDFDAPRSSKIVPTKTITTFTESSPTFKPREPAVIVTSPLPPPPPQKPPIVQKKLKKYAITNGRSLRLQIPEETFFDLIDGNTRNLRVDIREEDGSPLRVPWLKYDPKIQTIFALPFDENGIGRYIFNIVATNSKGLSVSDNLEIIVRQYSGARLVNHQFNVEFSFANWRPGATKGWEWHVSYLGFIFVWFNG